MRRESVGSPSSSMAFSCGIGGMRLKAPTVSGIQCGDAATVLVGRGIGATMSWTLSASLLSTAQALTGNDVRLLALPYS